MDLLRFGRSLRALRRRRGWTQAVLATRVGLSQQAISLIERGHGGRLAIDTVARVFRELDARLELVVSWRGGGLDRLLDADHAALVAEVTRQLLAAGWEVDVEVTYSNYGERGSIDVLGYRTSERAAVVVEVKSDLTIIDATVRKTDEKERNVVETIAPQRLGFAPASIARLLVLPESSSARARVERVGPVFEVTFPARGHAVRQWLARPEGRLAGILFISVTHGGGATRRIGGSHRVRMPRTDRPAATANGTATSIGGVAPH